MWVSLLFKGLCILNCIYRAMWVKIRKKKNPIMSSLKVITLIISSNIVRQWEKGSVGVAYGPILESFDLTRQKRHREHYVDVIPSLFLPLVTWKSLKAFWLSFPWNNMFFHSSENSGDGRWPYCVLLTLSVLSQILPQKDVEKVLHHSPMSSLFSGIT